MSNLKPDKPEAAGFVVENPGPHSLIQDSGRRGVLHLGLTSAGPMDKLTYDWANRLCGNLAGTAALEITFGGLAVRASAATRIVLCGPPVECTHNGKPVDIWQGLDLASGDKLAIGHVHSGCRLYLAVRGGFQVVQVFGSAATVVREGLGGVEGRALQRGDFLHFPEHGARQNLGADSRKRFSLPDYLRPDYPAADDSVHTLRVIPCLDARHIPRQEKLHFFSQVYSVSNDINRMGYRLEGKALAFKTGAILSQGIAPGTIQIPPNGQPIVLMRDHPTIGGYPKIGVLLSADMNRLAQLQPGAKLRFVPITVNRAQQALRMAKQSYESTCPIVLQ